MSRTRKQDLAVGVGAALLVALALFCRFAARVAPFPALDKLLNFVRTFLYIGLVLAWLFSVERRVIRAKTRRMLVAVSVLMLFWIVLREFKWRFVLHAGVLRGLWYAYYIPLLYIPLLALLIAVSLGRREDFRLPRAAAVLFAVTSLLALLVLTNDLHETVFRFPENAAVRSDSDYTYGAGYFLIYFWVFVCAAAALFVMLKKCRLPHGKRTLWTPFLPFGVSVLYTVAYIADVPLVRVVFGDFAIFQCVAFIAFFESCIRCGLIPSNARYLDLFHASVGLSVRITDPAYTVMYAASDSRPLPLEEMKRAEEGPVILPGGRRLHNLPIDGGHAVWTEDVSELLALRGMLEDRREELEERGALLQYEYNREKEHKTVEEQNRLYDLLQSKTQRQIDRIDAIVRRYRLTESDADKRRLLSHIIVLGSYVKRRKDFILSSDSSPEISESKLESALAESFRALRTLGIRGAFFVETGKETLPGEVLTRAYDFFEDVLETVLENARYLNVRVCPVAGELRIGVLADCTAVPDELSRKYPRMTYTEEDGGEWTLPLEGGGAV